MFGDGTLNENELKNDEGGGQTMKHDYARKKIRSGVFTLDRVDVRTKLNSILQLYIVCRNKHLLCFCKRFIFIYKFISKL